MTTRSQQSIPLLDVFYREFYEDPLFKAFYEDSGYANFGYWDRDISSAPAASDRLVEKLLEYLPVCRGKVLDVACGHGGSTRYLSRKFKPGNITGIGMVKKQISAAKNRVPTCRFKVMNATALDFKSATFDVVICVEAAFHFQTRERFFAEALRVLKPGGYLILSDLLMAPGAPMVPVENYIENHRVYAQRMRRSGFKDVKVADATGQTWHPYRRAFNRFMTTRMSDYVSVNGLRNLYTINVNSSWAIRACLLAAGRKPA